jgi:hypothetical protein
MSDSLKSNDSDKSTATTASMTSNGSTQGKKYELKRFSEADTKKKPHLKNFYKYMEGGGFFSFSPKTIRIEDCNYNNYTSKPPFKFNDFQNLFYPYNSAFNAEKADYETDINGKPTEVLYNTHPSKFIIFAKDKTENPEGFFVGTCKYSVIQVKDRKSNIIYNRGIIDFFDINDNTTIIGSMFNLPPNITGDHEIFNQKNEYNINNNFLNGTWQMYQIENNDKCANAINNGTIVENDGGSRSRKSQRKHKSKKYARKTIRKHKSRKNRK